MDLGDDEQRAAWRDHLAATVRDRKVIAALAPLAAMTGWVDLLRDAGAQRPLLVATGIGAGPVPGEQDADIVVVDVPAYASMTEQLRADDALARNLPPEVRAAVRAYDPAGEAVWLVGPFVHTEPIDGRPVLGGRPAAWYALEDKLLAEDIWASVGAAHASARVVPVDPAALSRASAELDEGAGVVWAGDARDGFNGGGDFTRWVVDARDRAAALAFFAPRCDRVRVMPFLDGVPCSIHGIVLPDGTATFRPVELAILRGEDRRFVYGGQGTTWDPPADDRVEMRDLARRTGEHLRERVDYRGAFGIDGILGRDGFRPTELNSRSAAGIVTQTQALDSAAFTLLQLSCVAGHDPGVTVAELEAWAMPVLDAQRVSRAIGMAPRRVTEVSRTLPVRWDGAHLTTATEDTADACVLVGPSGAGTFCRLVSDLLGPGERVGDLNAAMMRFLDAELGTGFGPVQVPPDVRS